MDALASHRDVNPSVLGAAAPFGRTAGVQRLAPDDLAVMGHRALPTPVGAAKGPGFVHVYPGDLDCDGRRDLAAAVDQGTWQPLLVLCHGPDGLFLSRPSGSPRGFVGRRRCDTTRGAVVISRWTGQPAVRSRTRSRLTGWASRSGSRCSERAEVPAMASAGAALVLHTLLWTSPPHPRALIRGALSPRRYASRCSPRGRA